MCAIKQISMKELLKADLGLPASERNSYIPIKDITYAQWIIFSDSDIGLIDISDTAKALEDIFDEETEITWGHCFSSESEYGITLVVFRKLVEESEAM